MLTTLFFVFIQFSNYTVVLPLYLQIAHCKLDDDDDDDER